MRIYMGLELRSPDGASLQGEFFLLFFVDANGVICLNDGLEYYFLCPNIFNRTT